MSPDIGHVVSVDLFPSHWALGEALRPNDAGKDRKVEPDRALKRLLQQVNDPVRYNLSFLCPVRAICSAQHELALNRTENEKT